MTDWGGTLRGANRWSWRAGTSEFGVQVLFSQRYPTTLAERNRARNEIASVVELEHPAHTSWVLNL